MPEASVLLPSNSKRLPRFLNNFILANRQTAVLGSVRIVGNSCKPRAICGGRRRDSETWLATESLQPRNDLDIKCVQHYASCFPNKRLVDYLFEGGGSGHTGVVDLWCPATAHVDMPSYSKDCARAKCRTRALCYYSRRWFPAGGARTSASSQNPDRDLDVSDLYVVVWMPTQWVCTCDGKFALYTRYDLGPITAL
jgi:hypothetical protein